MHMADALVSPAVGGVMLAAGGAAMAYAVVQTKKEELITPQKIPLMGVMSAFVFAAQMINFTIPGTGSSGHIGGGILLASLLGGGPAFICMSVVLLIQALFFADGGLLAYGCNLFNMGVFPCLLVYPLIVKPILKKKISYVRILTASLIGAVFGLQLGSFAVVVETLVSGITSLPFTPFLLLMQPIHLAIGLIEGIITAAVLLCIQKARPELIESAAADQQLPKDKSMKKVIILLLICAIAIGGGLSLAASSLPDGLEWSILGVTGSEEPETESTVHESANKAQEATSFMPDYGFKGSEDPAGTSVAGLVGGSIVLIVTAGAAAAIVAVKKKKQSKEKTGE